MNQTPKQQKIDPNLQSVLDAARRKAGLGAAMSKHEEVAQKLIPCTCGGYGFNRRRHMSDCPRHYVAWEDLAEAIEKAANARIAELEAERDKLRKLYSAAWAECDAWRQYDNADPMVKGECVREARSKEVAHDALRREAGEVSK